MRSTKKVFRNPLDMLAGMWPTPLLRLSSYCSLGVEAWAKLEFMNPFSRSVKDRTVLNMIMKARERGELRGKLYEATSGNVGIAMAALSNILGLKFRAYVPSVTPETTETLLRVLGAEVVRTEFTTIPPEMVEMVVEEAEREGATNLNQYVNEDNFEAHYKWTAPEIDSQIKEAVGAHPNVIVGGIGTSGHLCAIATYFKEKYGSVKAVAVMPAESQSIPGLRRLEANQKWVSEVEIDEFIEVELKES